MQDRLPDKDNQELTKVMEWLAKKLACPLCGFHYNINRVTVVPRSLSPVKDVLLHTNCGQCECGLLFALDIRGGEVFLVGIVTDLSLQDVVRFQNMKPISSDECLDWYKFWRSFSGDFEKVLPQA